MTREEQIDWLCRLRADLNNGVIFTPWNKEFTEALNDALQQEPTTKNDLGVDWDELKRKIFMEVDGGMDGNWLRYGDVCDNISDSIDDFKANLPPVKPQEPRWIPVNERLPENKETVLVTFKHHISGNSIGLGSMVVLRDKPHWHVREQNLGTYDVIAWMPLPKSYKAESEE